MPERAANLADCPVPFAEPEIPALPAMVETLPKAMPTLRIVKFELSATYRFVPSVVIPSGFQKLAAVPVPSAEPAAELPTKVKTPGESLRDVPWMAPPI